MYVESYSFNVTIPDGAVILIKFALHVSLANSKWKGNMWSWVQVFESESYQYNHDVEPSVGTPACKRAVELTLRLYTGLPTDGAHMPDLISF